MASDFTIFLWSLKLGALINLCFLANTFGLPAATADAHLVMPAQVFFSVSTYRCLFPVWYKGNVVFHRSRFSSIFVTRGLATLSEVAFVYQFSHVIRLLNIDDVGWVTALSWVMVLQVVISQGFVWAAVLTRRLVFYYYEEMGWAIIFAANTMASVHLYLTVDAPAGGATLLHLNLLFGSVYLPWQLIHLRAQLSDARRGGEMAESGTPVTWMLLGAGLRRSIRVRNRTTDAAAWGGFVGLTWMTGYWATLIPMWVNQVVVVFSR
jgi:hypothetical protein